MKQIFLCIGVATTILLASCGNTTATNKEKNSTTKEAATADTETIPHPKIPIAKGTPRILFVGNSHTEYYVSMPVLFEEFCAANKQTISVDMLVTMSVDIAAIYADHKAEADVSFAKKDADGNYYDYVVLQEQTPVAFENLEKYKTDVKMMAEKIRKNSPGAAIYIYEGMSFAPYKTNDKPYNEYYAQMKGNALEVTKQTSNAALYRVGDAVKDAYESKEGYQHQVDGKDRLRFGETEGTLHLLNDGGFLEAALLYATIFDTMPVLPEQLTLSTGTGEHDAEKKMAVANAISNPKALAAIAFKNR